MNDAQDEDLAKAIALSLQDSGPQRTAEARQVEYVVISDDEDGDDGQFQADLERAIEASKHAESSRATSSTAPSVASRSDAAPSFLSERAQLERERLARQKRLRPELDVDNVEAEEIQKAKRQHLSPSSSGSRRTNHCDMSSNPSSSEFSFTGATTTAASSSKGPWDEHLYWKGEQRQIANRYVDEVKDRRPTFRLSDILAPRDDIVFAIVSSYVYNYPWLYSLFNPNTPVITVAQDQNGNESIKTILPNWVRTTPFLRNGMGCMHMKFMLLFYSSRRLRVVVSTANMVEYDWRDIENTVWLQDIPPRPEPIAHDQKADDFPATFTRVLRALNVAPALISHLRNDHPDLPIQRLEELRMHWDFSKVQVQLIPSLAGKHEGWPQVILTGHTALMKALRNMKAATEKGQELVLECQGSSIGTYSTQWMNEFYCSARGESAQSWLDKPKASRAKLPYPPIKILFPTLQYVRESRLGEQGGGTMFCRRNQWEGTRFPRGLFHQSRSKRGKVLMHSKMIVGTFRDRSGASGSGGSSSDSETEDDDEGVESVPNKLVGWAYVGSHNFTPSAWGTLSGSAFNPTLNVTNFELGILLPLHSEREANEVACWERPPTKYVLGKDEPWIQTESPALAMR